MACRSCKDPIIVVTEEKTDWLTREQVKSICIDCYNNMVKNNISKIKRLALEGNTNIMYELLFTGQKGQALNIGGITLIPFEPQYFYSNELPVSIKDLRKIPNLEIEKVSFVDKPTSKEAKIHGAKKANQVVVIWRGSTPKRVNDYGTFVKGEPVIGLPQSAIKELKKLPGFEVING